MASHTCACCDAPTLPDACERCGEIVCEDCCDDDNPDARVCLTCVAESTGLPRGEAAAMARANAASARVARDAHRARIAI